MKLPGSKGYRPWSWSWPKGAQRGRIVSVYGDLSNFMRPRINPNIEVGYVGITFALEDGNCDPFAAVNFDLTDTRFGQWLLATAIRWDQWNGRGGRHRR